MDDSVSTSPPAVIAALRSFEGGIRLLAGGYDKGLETDQLQREILSRCEKAYFFGDVKTRMARGLTRLQESWAVEPRQGDIGRCRWTEHANLEEAFESARREASPGDLVLFSPGFASYDQFRNFSERGELFRSLVQKVAASCIQDAAQENPPGPVPPLRFSQEQP